MEIGLKEKCTVKENIHGLTGEVMKESILKIKNKDMGYILGLMVVSMMENGLMVYNMDGESFLLKNKNGS